MNSPLVDVIRLLSPERIVLEEYPSGKTGTEIVLDRLETCADSNHRLDGSLQKSTLRSRTSDHSLEDVEDDKALVGREVQALVVEADVVHCPRHERLRAGSVGSFAAWRGLGEEAVERAGLTGGRVGRDGFEHMKG